MSSTVTEVPSVEVRPWASVAVKETGNVPRLKVEPEAGEATTATLALQRSLALALRARMDDGDATALLIVPSGFARAMLLEEPVALQLVVNPSKGVSRLMVQESLALALEGVFYAHRILGAPLREIIAELEEGGTGEETSASDATVGPR